MAGGYRHRPTGLQEVAGRLRGLSRSDTARRQALTGMGISFDPLTGDLDIPGSVTVDNGGPVGPQSMTYLDDYGADPTGHLDNSEALISALGSLPTQMDPAGNTWPVGQILVGRGQYGFDSPIGNLGPYVTFEGQGRWVTTLLCRTTGPFLVVRGANSGSFDQIGFGGRVAGLTIDGSGAPGAAIGLQVTDAEEVEVDVAIQHFNQAGSVGYNQHNTSRWQEKIDARLALYDNTTAFLLDTGGTSTSNEYCNWDVTLYMLGSQDGVVIEGGADTNHAIYISGSRLSVRGNAKCSDPAANTGAVLRWGDHVRMFRGELNVAVEVGPGTNGPQRVNFGAGVTLHATGGVGFAGSDAWAASTVGSNLTWDLQGQIRSEPTLENFANKLQSGSTPITITSGTTTGTAVVTFPWPFISGAPAVFLGLGDNGVGCAANYHTTTTTGTNVQVYTTDGTAVTADTTISVHWLAVGNF